MTTDKATYEEFVEQDEKLASLLPPQVWNFVEGCNSHTGGSLNDTWQANLKKNVKKLLRKHKSVAEDFIGLGSDKAIIGVGAGPSFNLNKDVLRQVYAYNLLFDFKDQPFLIIASNHQYKPLLKMGIVPHFVMLIDAGDAVYDQLCTDIPEHGQKTFLLASLQSSPKVLREWDRQGRVISFYAHSNPECMELYEKLTKKDPTRMELPSGGNVMNAIWMLSLRVFHSTVFMALGNDLSYPYDPSYENRTLNFYADGDYTVNIKNQRDEAARPLAWLGLKFVDNVFTGKPHVNLETVGTSLQLFIYKLWVELHATAWSSGDNRAFQYYNCSESGILGVVPKSYDQTDVHDKDNWQLLDTIIPERWRTRRFKDAISEYLKARQLCQDQRGIIEDAGAHNVIISPQGTGGAGNAGQVILPHGRANPTYGGITL